MDDYAHGLIRVNLQGTFNVYRASIPHLSSGSSVVNVSSIVGIQPRAKGWYHWALQFYGLGAWPEGYSSQCRGSGGDPYTSTNVSVVSGEETMQRAAEKVALGRLGQPDEIADVVAWIFQSSYMNGSVVEINGGLQ